MSGDRPLEPRQKRFVEEYLIDLNATQAAIRAGYSKPTAQEQSSRLLSNVIVAKAIEAGQKARSERTQITSDNVIKELAKLGFCNMLDYIRVQDDGTAFTDLSAMTRDQAAAISEITVDEYTEGRGEDAKEIKRVKIKIADKRASLVDIGRHLGMFKEKVEVSGPDGGPVQSIGIVTADPVEAAKAYKKLVSGQ